MVSEVPDAVVVGEASDGEAAVIEAARTKADVLLLDINMPGVDGLTLAQRTQLLPPVIFCTAHGDHALKAFEVNAVDYLLKPVRQERLVAALKKARARGVLGQAAVFETLAAAGPDKVISVDASGLRFFDVMSITRFWASQKYTLFLAAGAEQLTEEPLNSLEERLGASFLRVHRSELVRLSAVERFLSDEEGHLLELADGQRVRVSRRSVTAVKQALGVKP
jgi:DNA-binding LytR/AlgR family response regulator